MHNDSRSSAVVEYLRDWAEWQRGSRIDVGYPHHSSGFGRGGEVVSRESSDHDQADAEHERCRILDRLIDDLPVPAQRAAIHRCYLSAVYRLRDYEQFLADAHDSLARAMRAKGCFVGV